MLLNITRKIFIAPALLIASGSLFAAPSNSTDLKGPVAMVTVITATPQYAADNEASDLLKQIQTQAVQLSNDSATLASFSRSSLSRQSHAAYLNMVKQHINQTGRDLGRLEEIKSYAAPWQQQAINQLVPLAQQVASNTEAAINYLNENPNSLFAPTYAQTLEAIAGSASEMKDRVNDFLDIAATNQKANELYQKAYELQIKADELQMKLAKSNS
jgi:signal transduction histidine kinase